MRGLCSSQMQSGFNRSGQSCLLARMSFASMADASCSSRQRDGSCSHAAHSSLSASQPDSVSSAESSFPTTSLESLAGCWGTCAGRGLLSVTSLDEEEELFLGGFSGG